MADRELYDVVIVGGGIVGCAMFRKSVLQGAKTLLIEKGDYILSGASKANSAILHTGFDAPPDSLELECVKRGHQEYLDIYESMNLTVDKSGAVVVAWNQEQLDKLPSLLEKAHKNGVTDVRLIDKKELLELEGHLSDKAMGALYVPRESLIDPWSAPYAYVKQGIVNGGKCLLNCELTACSKDKDNSIWTLNTTQGAIDCKMVINCAGLFGDHVENMVHKSPFVIKPRKGQFVVFDKTAASLAKPIILPVPTEITKGIVITRTAFGNLLVGPTAEEQEDRVHARVEYDVLKELIDKGNELIPELKNHPVTTLYAGLRPATEQKEYRVAFYPEKNWICVGGIRSTGLTAALGIASYVFDTIKDNFAMNLKPLEKVETPVVPVISEFGKRSYEIDLNTEIVCHCERVTRKEIVEALNGILPPASIGAFKRRTRAMMGRCQGFYCSGKVAELTNNFFES
ncbi:L-2-hydroxyglutarate oxidase LhgO [Anaerobiospirillum thomasii]|uniref:L-2-hydroxyglutarate oxidase LhgO n=1 Tax=Anaerobiospirillum thomasii TaxID=179995 RepID=A0A2X0V6P8_9GAMM|nr:NAD(P)/FAD-dependent oxidoreductase [Anaerobiospirillum thomasii]SPT68445.1 L-2-hydroxyglutarate oxidase LhgO [Anaerobiospirillum thomasii]SPT70951.1 L-2-hydroxyglutarate oxidase LhgO [Anaerobiospirillum thomasii]